MTTKITEQNISQLANAGVNWQPVVTADGSTGLTAVAGRGYFIDTTSGAQTVTLPASPKVGDVVVLKDYARTWGTNNVTIASTLLDGGTLSTTFSTSGQTVTLVRMDNTKGWSIVNEDTTTSLNPPIFISATGGTVTTSGDYKIHTFTGDGCFVVSTLGNAPQNPSGGPNTVSYMVVAGGGGGLFDRGGAGGAGGFREGKCTSDSYTTSPLNAPDGLPVAVTTYPITVGGGGAAQPSVPLPGNPGSNSVFSTITSTGGGSGGRSTGVPGGSGGGGGNCGAGTGNTPPVSPPQGTNGGQGSPNSPPVGNGGGGGATQAGTNGLASAGGDGGDGAQTSINASATYYAGGGGGGHDGGTKGCGGQGGGGNGASGPYPGSSVQAQDGTANKGGGAGGSNGGGPSANAKSGGSGIVIIRYKFQ